MPILLKKKILILILSVIIVTLFLPEKVECNIKGRTCAMPPVNPNEKVSYVYEIQPLGITLIEYITGDDSGIHYSAGVETEAL